MTKLFNLKLLLALVTCLMCGLVANAYSFRVDAVFYNITSSSTVEVVGDTQSSADWTPATMPDGLVATYSGYVKVPETVTYNGTTYTVTGVGHCAFVGSSATFIDLPSTITYIGNLAFIGSHVRTLKCRATTPPNCQFQYSIADMNYIETIYVPEEAIDSYKYATRWSSYRDYFEALPDYDFTNNNLKYAITGNTTAKVVGFAVANPSGSWTIPATSSGYTITEIGNQAFINSKNITGMIVGSNVTTIGANGRDIATHYHRNDSGQQCHDHWHLCLLWLFIFGQCGAEGGLDHHRPWRIRLLHCIAHHLTAQPAEDNC